MGNATLPRWAQVVLVESFRPQLATGAGKGLLDVTDKLALLGRLQSQARLGAAMLEASVCASDSAKAKVAQALVPVANHHLGALNEIGPVRDVIARVTAGMVVVELIDSPRCPHCHGVGNYMARRLGRIVECRHCAGVGRVILTDRRLRDCYSSMGVGMTDASWAIVYDAYMSTADHARQEQSRAVTLLKEWIEGEAVAAT